MDKVSRLLEHEFPNQQGKATYKQCKRIWSLCIIVGVDPVWCKGMSYASAIALITKLETIRGLKYGDK